MQAATVLATTSVPTTAEAQRFWADRDGAILEQYWAAGRQPHRQALVAVLHTLPNVRSVLELGIMAGTNLQLVHDAFPWITLFGTDINTPALAFARAHLPALVQLSQATAIDSLRAQPAQSLDVIMTCYTLAYLDRHDVVPALIEMLRVARRALILAEPHTPTGTVLIRQTPMPEWAHDYGVVLESYLRESPTRTGRVEVFPLATAVDHCNAVTVVRFTS